MLLSSDWRCLEICSPLVTHTKFHCSTLLYVNSNNQLMPIAIQREEPNPTGDNYNWIGIVDGQDKQINPYDQCLL